MKINNIFKFIILVLIYTGLSAKDFYIYKLFDNKFQTIFPNAPISISDKAYQYMEQEQSKQLAIFAQDMPYDLKYDIGKYKQKYKQYFDDNFVKIPLKLNGYKILKFSSVFSRKENVYISLYTVTYDSIGQKWYRSTKYIIYKKKAFSWTVLSTDLNYTESIFNRYKDYCKIIK